MGLRGKGSSGHRDVLYGGSVEELAWYDISLEGLRKIANATNVEVEVKVTGDRYYVTRRLKETNLQNLRRFVVEYGQ